MAETLYSERRRGQRPEVQGIGGGVAINWQPTESQSPFGRILQSLNVFMESQRQAEQKRQENLAKQFDMYKTLRESGYDSKSAYDATLKGRRGAPAQPGGTSLKEESTRAQIGLTEAKAKYYRQGGSRRTVIDRMTPNQLQSRLRYLEESFADDQETKEEIREITRRLREMTMGKAGKNNNEFEALREFETPEEADDSGLPPGTIVRIKGRRYEI